jgi:hypothetical protein
LAIGNLKNFILQGRIASEAYILTSAQMLINSMLAKHEQPAVLSAVMKYETTSRSRNVVNDGNNHDLESKQLDFWSLNYPHFNLLM